MPSLNIFPHAKSFCVIIGLLLLNPSVAVSSPSPGYGAIHGFINYFTKRPLTSLLTSRNKKIAATVVATTGVATYIADPYIAPTVIPFLNKHRQNPEKLIAQNHLQEAIWYYKEAGDEKTANELNKSLLETLSHSKGAPIQTWLGGASLKTVLVFDNGIKGMFKPSESNKYVNSGAEVAAYALDQLLELNLVPLTIPYNFNGETGSLQYLIRGARTGQYRYSYQYRRMLFLDYLIGNPDRHMDNWMCASTGFRAIAIDNALSFGTEEVRSRTRFNFNYGIISESQGRFFYLPRLDDQIKEKVIKLRDEEIIEALRDTVEPESIELVLGRLHEVQKYLKSDT